ncbi:MAG: ABC transporter ATP-binding protein [Chloroflexi bacterium]|nr:ABC transporter ATP-binding protein [Chloroflexota bacterium]
MIVAENLTKRYGAVMALDHLAFSISPGEAVALWGANGAGKTTALRCLLGLLSFEGKVIVNGIDVQRRSKQARAVIGYVPQEASFYDLSVAQTLHFYARLKKAAETEISRVLQNVQLEEHSAKRVSALSGGMKQRLALAVALLNNPPILMLDEPTANLDVQAQRDFSHLIQNLNQAGKTIVFSSHRLDEVLTLAKRVLVLADGRLKLECAPEQLAQQLELYRWLRIWVHAAHYHSTQQVLRQNRYVCTPNGTSVYVRVNEGSKMAPLRLLESQAIPVEDFELLDQQPAQEALP